MELKLKILKLFIVISFFITSKSYAFCGFYVAKADVSLFNKASQVVLVRDGKRTVISMMNDYEGKLQNFAMVVPVPSVLKKGQIHIGQKNLFSRIDSFTAPRLVEYFDKNPCALRDPRLSFFSSSANLSAKSTSGRKSLGVKVEAEYTIGEYDIVILSAKESNGLETWLRQNGYSIPKGASQALAPYIKQKMKFFVAKVNLKEQAKTGLSYLRPIQFAFESEKFMLPIRLGMLNAKGPQELFIYVLTKNGRVETTNYQTVKLPTDMEIPLYVKNEFSNFYRSMFNQQVKKERMKAVFMEYFWDMSWCDPCAAEPLTTEELKGLGVFWLNKNDDKNTLQRRQPIPSTAFLPASRKVQVKVTRLHLRYTKDTFPDDLMFQETNDTKNFQGRYVLRHPWKDAITPCEQAKAYYKNLPGRLDKRAQNLANLTGWDINEIRKKMNIKTSSSSKGKDDKNIPWWKSVWD